MGGARPPFAMGFCVPWRPKVLVLNDNTFISVTDTITNSITTINNTFTSVTGTTTNSITASPTPSPVPSSTAQIKEMSNLDLSTSQKARKKS